MKTVLSTQLEVWREQWLAEGEAKGKAEGKAEALICLLRERFGAVAPSRQKRIHGAKLVTLERWFKRAIVAPDLPSVFNPPREIKLRRNGARAWAAKACVPKTCVFLNVSDRPFLPELVTPS